MALLANAGRYPLAFVVAASYLVVTLVAAGGSPGAQTPGHVDVPLPAAWVPFSADVVTTALGTPTTDGKFYRRSDGSTAMLEHTPLGDMITIHNAETGSTYIRFGDMREWVRMGISESVRRPPQPILRLPGLRTQQLPDHVDGLDVWEMVAASSRGVVINRHAPALNGFLIFTDWLGTFRQEFTNIRIGEPPAAVFLPPPGTRFEEQAGPTPRPPSGAP